MTDFYERNKTEYYIPEELKINDLELMWKRRKKMLEEMGLTIEEATRFIQESKKNLWPDFI